MSLDVQLVLLQPTNVEFLPARASLQLPRDVLLVVANDLRDDACRAHTFCALCYEELTLFLDGLVDVVALGRTIGNVIVSDVVDLVLGQETGRDNPRTVLDDLVNPTTMTDGLGTFACRKYSETFATMCFVVASHADDEVGIGERVLCLFELAHVAVWVCQLCVRRAKEQ